MNRQSVVIPKPKHGEPTLSWYHQQIKRAIRRSLEEDQRGCKIFLTSLSFNGTKKNLHDDHDLKRLIGKEVVVTYNLYKQLDLFPG